VEYHKGTGHQPCTAVNSQVLSGQGFLPARQSAGRSCVWVRVCVRVDTCPAGTCRQGTYSFFLCSSICAHTGVFAAICLHLRAIVWPRSLYGGYDRRKRAKSTSEELGDARKALNTDGLHCQCARYPRRNLEGVRTLGRKNGLRNWQSTACAGVALQVQTKGGAPMGPTEMRKVL